MLNQITLVSVHSAYRRCADDNTGFFVAAAFKPTKTAEKLDHETRTIIDQCLKDYPELEAILTSPLPEPEALEPVDVLKSGNVELKKLAESKAPEKTYTKDFALRETAKLAAAERASSDLYPMSHAAT